MRFYGQVGRKADFLPVCLSRRLSIHPCAPAVPVTVDGQKTAHIRMSIASEVLP